MAPSDRLPLRDGRQVLLRLLGADDASRMAQFFLHLGDASWLQRFHSPGRRLSVRDWAAITAIEPRTREAIGALSVPDAAIVGVAQFVRDGHDATVAEVAVAVADAFQGSGLGTALLQRLAVRARAIGISRFRALIREPNRRVLTLGRRGGTRVRATYHYPGVIEAEIDLLPDARPAPAGAQEDT
ncbi:MAG TPA: GNAT family N-acetyltransferase [Chloroflexota bacterium]|nr:GNAT family N-acetyltransferase [Chloroflexota bacterium]